MQEQVLKILFIEDMPEDVELAKRKIRESGITFETYVAGNEDEFLRGLYKFKPDIIISDYLLLEFDGMKALEITLTYDDTIPFMILTRSANEELIVDAMKAGANDYLLKERINRLPFAIKEAMEKRNALKETKKAIGSLEFLSQIIEQSPYAVVSTDMHGTITSWNKSAERLYGYSANEALGQNISLVYLESDFVILQKDIIEPLIENGSNHKQVRLKRKDGTTFTGSLSLWTIRGRAGQPIGMVGYALDITKEKEAESALKESEERYRLLAENTLDCIWMMNTDLVFTYVNPAIYTMLGFTPEEWIGSKLSDHCDEENFRKMLGYAQAGMADPNNFTSITFQTEFFNINGKRVPVEIIGKVLTDEDGRTIALQGTTKDITNKLLAEKALKESEERLKLAMKVSEHGFWEWDIESDNFYFSPGSYKMFGYEDEEFPMSIEKWKEMMHPDDRKNIMPVIIRSIEEGGAFNFEIRMLTISGKWRWILAKGSTFKGENKNRRAIGTLVDITERKKAEEQMILARIAAEDANRCKNELLANMNHELRTPLSSVIGYSDVLLDPGNDNLTSEQKKHLMTINTAGCKLLNLVNNMLDLAHIESDDMTIRFSKFDPVKSIEKMIEGTTLLAKKKRITIDVNVHENITDITADIDKFRKIVYNLIENALKFTPENGTVTVDVMIRNDDIEVSVEDTGIGINESDRKRIFDPFVQVDGSHTRGFGGAGLGLVLVKEYLKMQKGTIWVESENGKGSKFTFRIPVSPLFRGNDI
ncbi:PAS domain S-box protein [Methanolobus sp. WCC4]|uniref:PAS domain S-box protein n=1 Tax=Methanolobus sp. WCC4 TaxID=3125784 RepID=UPI0030F5B691